MKIKESPVKQFILPVQGMHCASCAQLISTRVAQLPSIHDVAVSYATEQIRFKGDSSSLKQVVDQVADLGYKIVITEQNNNHVQTIKTTVNEDQSWQTVFPIAVFLFLVMLYELIAQRLTQLPPVPLPMMVMQFSWWLAATYTLFVSGNRFISALARFARLRVANMDTLIGVGTMTAYLYSTVALFFSSTLTKYSLPVFYYFDVVVVVVGFVLFGKHLESLMKFKTRSALESLAVLQVKHAIVLTKSGEKELPIDEVKLNDLVRVKHGEMVPLDGVVVEGDSLIDESLLTGESMPVTKSMGSRVLGGSSNRAGTLVIKVSAIQGQGFLQQVIDLVQSAQLSRAPIERLADTVARYFVPIVMVVALASSIGWLVWGSITQTATVQLAIQSLVGVLVIACPCALGLATPAAMVVAMGKAAQNGVLLKDAGTIEKLAKATTIVLDKTGTITVGKPELVSIQMLTNQSEEWALSIAAALERASAHPLASAIHEAAKTKKVAHRTATKIATVTALGVTGTIADKHYWIGGKQMLIKMKVKDIDSYLSKRGEMVIYMGSGQTLLTVFVLKDQLKESAHQSIAELQAMNMNVIILSGDQHQTVATIADQVGISSFFSEIKPDKKLAKIKELQATGQHVVMVGDGVNDAPALAQAEVGLAMSTGSDSAIATADATILNGDLHKVVFSLQAARQTMKIVKQNLIWAFMYNVVGIPLAAGWLYPLTGWLLNPGFAGAAMALSSISVVLNSLRLRQFSSRHETSLSS